MALSAASLREIFWDEDSLNKAWLRLIRDKIISEDDDTSVLLQHGPLSDELVRWAELSAIELRDMLIQQQAHRVQLLPR